MNTTQIVQADLIDVAGNMLEQQDAKDRKMTLLELTGISKHGIATGSGLNDFDYQNLSTLSMGYKQLNQIQNINKVPIPTEILEHFKHIKCHCMMGLFPEIGRAWLTIDSEIYIWTYEHSRDVAYYDGLNHLIVSVGLVKPKAGVFIKDVKYLLILTTPAEVIILGVTFNDMTKTISAHRNKQNTSTFEEMQLMSKPIFIVNTDSVPINIIEGTDDGRIFLGGRDGCLYEILYQAESSWFGKRCRKINHSQSLASYMVPNFIKAFTETDAIVRISIDNSRQLLYVLTEKGSIEAWYLGNNNNIRRISKVTQNEIAQSASNIIKTIDPSAFKPIKAICPISVDECSDLHLLAVTQYGVRLYFTTSELQLTESNRQQRNPITSHSVDDIFQQQQSPHDSNRRHGLFLLHVRLPPGYTPNTTINKPKQVHSAHYDDGTLLFISTPQQEQDILWCISSTPFPNRPYLTESTTVLPLDGIVWGLSDIKDKCDAKLPSILRKAQISKRIVLLTNQGVHIIALLTPVDILQQLLISCHGPHHEAVKAFFTAQSEREACATCLSLACAERFRGSDLAIWAAQAFMLYGGEPFLQQLQSGTSTDTTRNMMNTSLLLGGVCDRNVPQIHVSTPLPVGNITPLYRPLSTSNLQQSQYMLSPISNKKNVSNIKEFSNIVYSGKHDGLYIYVARLIRSIWKMPCIGKNLNSKLPLPDCTLILEDLYAIKEFVEANSLNEFSSTLNCYGNQTTLTNEFTHIVSKEGNDQKQIIDQVQNDEKRSLAALTYFIKHSCEVFGLWKILCEHQLHILINQLTNEQKEILKSCTFSDLILSRSDICAILIVSLINSYLKDNASVSSVSTKLREVCPTLYRHEDAVAFKATEILMNSRNCNIPDEKFENLRTALQLCKDAAPNLPLPNICQQFIQVGFYEGVIQLSSTCAAKIDPEEIGINFYKNNEPVEDRQGYAAFVARMTCYKEVRLMFDQLYQTLFNENANKEFSAVTFLGNKDSLTNKIMENVMMAMQIKDPLLHISVYEWLMINDMLSELLTLFEPSLGEYLKRNVIRNPQNLKLIDLLWKYYEKNGHHSQAAHILNELAMSNQSIPLEQRIEYLARAVMCMRNDGVGYSISNGVLLKELEDKLEIARVQKIILDCMAELATTNRDACKALEDLNNTLYNITDLYHNFADPYNLWECKLTILNCSHHNDPLLVESVWSHILNKALEGNDSLSERIIRLFSKVESLVKEFRESGHCFPLAFLIHELEVKACQFRFPEGIIPEKLVKLDLDIELLMEYYSRMISMNERIWANEGNDWHLVHSAIRLVTVVVSNSQSIWYRSKRRIIGKAQDIITICLNLCYQKPDTKRMQETLKELQCQLQRCIS